MVNTILSGLLLFTLFGAVYSSTIREVAAAAPVVDLGYAQYQGVFDTNTNVTNYRGIRYAASPAGKNRWRAPQAPAKVSGIQQANADPPSCFQAPNVGGLMIGSQVAAETEDCLFLNVASPGAAKPSKGLPVVVWIHGGGYVFGNASQFQAADLVRDSANSVVSVVIQYRLGLFGFLAGNDIKQNGNLNAGLRHRSEIRPYLGPKQCNYLLLRSLGRKSVAYDPSITQIAKFGGDPTKVTVWGSANGGGSVLQHIIAEDGQTNPKLFRAAITSSLDLPSQYGYNEQVPESLYQQALSQTNCASSSDHLACLRAVDAKTLGTANVNINAAGIYGTVSTVPVVDGTYVRQRPTEALKQGKLNTNTLLAVANSNEGVIFVDPAAPSNVSAYTQSLFPKFGSEQIAAVVQQYSSLGTQTEQKSLIYGEVFFICPTIFTAAAFKDRGYKGQFAPPPALHGNDINYYFPTSTLYGLPALYDNVDFQKTFAESFLSFVISQDPNVKVEPSSILPQWKKFSDGQSEMVFNITNNAPDIHSAAVDQALLNRCKFWDSLSAFTAQ
ncbi:hypothetical protein V5O48_002584 [Marasmius crinis-equi]|uniref:Carboxylesterase type B domain-containing protein n=1 Tax=Marasmius crinis-equi TaxID=585013 RepID=A0ABR3FV78_9AGAR